MRTCSVCNSSFPNFFPLPSGYFEYFNKLGTAYSLEDFETLNLGQYSCPCCQASDRDRLYSLYVKMMLRPALGKMLRILDIAPAPSLSNMLRSLPGVIYRSADLHSTLAEERVDVTDMQIYPENSFDLIVCSHVLEHVEDDARAISELYRVLAVGGRAILMVPILKTITESDEDFSVISIEDRWRRFGQDDHVRMYSKQDFVFRLQKGGFTVQQLGAENFGPDIFRLNGIVQSSVLYIGSKDAEK